MVRVLLLDHHTLVREGLRLIIEAQPGMEVVGGAGSSDEALALVAELSPDIILLELNLDGVEDITLIDELMGADDEARILLVTGINKSDTLHQAVQFGAMGIVRKEESRAVLLKAIRKVHSGEVWIDRAMMADVLTNLSRNRLGQEEDPDTIKIEQLSNREREVIALIGQGCKNKQIGVQLFISEVTVRHHLTSIYSKLEVSDRLELIIYAYQNQLAELPP